MIVVKFEPSGVEVLSSVGDCVVDITDESPKAGVPYGCRSASCGLCRVRVEEGVEALQAPGEDETQLLAYFGEESDVRLACQLKISGTTQRIRLRVITI